MTITLCLLLVVVVVVVVGARDGCRITEEPKRLKRTLFIRTKHNMQIL